MPPRASDLRRTYLPNRRGNTSAMARFQTGHRRTFSRPVRAALLADFDRVNMRAGAQTGDELWRRLRALGPEVFPRARDDGEAGRALGRGVVVARVDDAQAAESAPGQVADGGIRVARHGLEQRSP